MAAPAAARSNTVKNTNIMQAGPTQRCQRSGHPQAVGRRNGFGTRLCSSSSSSGSSSSRHARWIVRANNGEKGTSTGSKDEEAKNGGGLAGALGRAAERMGISMGPIALSLQEDVKSPKEGSSGFPELGPIGLTMGGDMELPRRRDGESDDESGTVVKLNSLSTEEWEAKFINADGTVDLWLEDDYNAASRMPAGRPYGSHENIAWSGKVTSDPSVPVHTVKITGRPSEEDPNAPPEVLSVRTAADRYVLFEAEEQGLNLPAACRMGCCTVCAVRVKSGTISQPQALGLSATLKAQGYALLCVGFAKSDLEVELQDPDEVYDMQFGDAFRDMGADSILRDDFALEIAMGDE